MAVLAISLTVFDAKDAESTITLYTTDDTNLVSIVNAVIALVPIVGSMITGGFRPKARIGIDVDLTVAADWTDYDSPLSTSDVEEGLFYEFQSEEINSIRSGRIPTISENLFLTGSREVDPDNTDWQAFETAMLSFLTVSNGAGTSNVHFTDKYGNELASTRDAYEQFVGSRAK